MKNKNTLITVIVVVILAAIAVGATAFKNDDSKTTMTNNDMMDMSMPENGTMNNDMSNNSQVVEGNQVTYKGFAVSPKTLKVKKGTTVTWTNQDDAKHDVTPDSETADFKASELFGKGESYSVTFNTVGTFNYICSPHPYMKGTIEVVE